MQRIHESADERNIMKYYFCTELGLAFDEAVSMVKKALKSEGFGVLTEIDVRTTLLEKLNVEFPNYTILGACNPAFALRALKKESRIGTMLPCNVIVRELENGRIEVCSVDPVASMQAVNNEDLGEVAEQIGMKLQSVVKNLS